MARQNLHNNDDIYEDKENNNSPYNNFDYDDDEEDEDDEYKRDDYEDNIFNPVHLRNNKRKLSIDESVSDSLRNMNLRQ